MADKNEIYKRIKIAGLLSFIPFLLIGGALAGYLAGGLILKIFPSLPWILTACVLLGVLSSVIEVVKVVRFALKIEKGL